MRAYALGHLSDDDLVHGATTLVVRDRATTAELLAHLAEIESRRLHVSAGYTSMRVYCVAKLGLSEDMAYKRITAARAARDCPALSEAVADGRLNLSAVLLLGPHLTPENSAGLIAAAAGQSNARIEELIAQRFPQSEVMPLVQPLPTAVPDEQLAARRVEAPSEAPTGAPPEQLAARRVAGTPPARVTPRAPQRYSVQFMIDQGTHDKLEYARALMSHQPSAGDLDQLFERSLDALIEGLEKGKLGAASRTRRGRRSSTSKRHVPAHVRRAVWERDQGRCTFVAEVGHRCESHRRLEFDHIVPVARGGEATVENIRLRCRAHNQLEAERVFGAGFMQEKRETSRRAAEARRRGAARESRVPGEAVPAAP